MAEQDHNNVKILEQNKDLEGLLKCLDLPNDLMQEKALQAMARLDDKKAIDPLINFIGKSSKNPQMAAILALTDLCKDSPEPLIKALKNESDTIKIAAAEALARTGNLSFFDNIVELFSNENRNVRRKTALAVCKLGPDIVPKLIELIQNKNEFVKTAAVEAIGAINDLRALDKLVEALKDDNIDVQNEIIAALVKLGKPAVAPLVEALSNENLIIKSNALECLNRMSAEESIDSIILLLKHEAESIRAKAAETLGEFKNPKAVQPVLETLDDSSDRVQAKAAEALGKIGGTVMIDPLLKALKEGNDNVKIKAALYLGKVGNAGVVGSLIEALQEKNKLIIINAAESLEKLQDKRAVAPLIELLKHPDTTVKIKAQESLGKLKDESAIPALILSMKDENPAVRENASAAVVKIGQKAVEPLTKILEDDNEYIREKVVDTLGYLGGKQSTEILIHSLKDQSDRVRAKAAESLTRVENVKDLEQAIDPLIQLSKDEVAAVRQMAALALGKTQHPKAITPLIELLGDDNRFVRGAVSAAFGFMGILGVKPLIESLKSTSITVREKASEILTNLKAPGTVEILILSLKKNMAAEVRKEIAKILSTVDDPRAIQALKEAALDSDQAVKSTAQDSLKNLKNTVSENIEMSERCPKCEGPLKEHKDDKSLVGWILAFVGLVLMPVLIGIPILLYGMRMAMKKSGYKSCLYCGYKTEREWYD